MQLTENRYENKLLLDLPPNARDIAEEFLSETNLTELLRMQAENEPDMDLLKQHHVSAKLWQNILQATLLAKTTYFLPSPTLEQQELLYLVKVACKNAGFSLTKTPLPEIIEKTSFEMPVLHDWLKNMAQLLIDKK